MSLRPAPAVWTAVCLALVLGGCTTSPQVRDAALSADPPCPLETGERYEGPPIYEDDPVLPARKRAWEAAQGGTEAARPLVKARLQGWPAKLRVPPGSLPTEDAAFLRRIASDTWRGLDAFTDREHGLPIDNVRFLGSTPAVATSPIGDYTNITNVGLHLIAVTAALELGLLSHEAALERLHRSFATLERLEQHSGFFFNYYDTTSLERTSNFLSFVDNSWLLAGLVVVRNAFPELASEASRWIGAMDYAFFYDPELGQMSHGYFVHRGARSRFHYGVFYTEARLGILLAIGKGDVPARAWFEPVRIYPPSCAGQNLLPQDLRWAKGLGHMYLTGLYEWRGIRFVPSWGGSMFEALMPTLVLDESRFAPRSLGRNGARHVLVQRRFGLEERGDPVWGASPSAVPGGEAAGTYGEYGVPVLGMRGYRSGAVTPHATALAIAFAPAESIANLRTLAERYELYGEFGFFDAVDPQSGAVARSYLALDQSMLFLALANHLSEGAIQRHFASDPIVRRALPVLAIEDFFPAEE